MSDAVEVALILKGVDAASDVFGGIASVLGGPVAVAAGVATAAVGALGAGLGLALSEASGAQQVMAQTVAVIQSTGGAAGLTADAVADLATALSLTSRFSDDAIQQGENLLLTFTNIGADVFPDATQAMVDMATAMGTDVSSGAIQLGKALNDPIAGIGALSRVGVTFTEDQKKVIESLVATGDVAGAQAIILAELNKEFGGSAAAAAETFAGQMDVMKNRLLNVAEAIGGPLLEVGADLIDTFLVPILPLIEGLGAGFSEFLALIIDGNIGGAFDALAVSFYKMFGPDAGLAVMQVKDVVLGLVDFVVANLPLMQETFATVWSTIQGVLTVVGEFVTGTLLPALATIWDTTGAELPTAQAVVESVMAAIVVAFELAAAYVTDFLIPAYTGLVNWVVANWPTIQATIEAVIAGVSAVITSVMTTISEFWAANGEGILASAAATWTGIQTAIEVAITTAQSIIATTLEAVAAFWTAHGDSVMTIVSFIWETIQTNVENAITTVQTVIETVLGAIQLFWDAWGGTIMDVVANMVESVQLTIDLFAAALEGDWTAFGETLKGLWQTNWDSMVAIIGTAIDSILAIDWLGLGSDIIAGIISGVSSMNSALTEAVQGAAAAALEAAKAFLGISSPSKVFEGIGANMVEGWAGGIDSNSGMVASAVVDTAGSAVGAAGSGASGPSYSQVFNIEAHYANQPERRLIDDIRVYQMLTAPS